MTRDEIRKAMEWEHFDYPQIEIAITRIEKIIAEAVKREREACAAICDEHRSRARIGVPRIAACAASIRARGQQ